MGMESYYISFLMRNVQRENNEIIDLDTFSYRGISNILITDFINYLCDMGIKCQKNKEFEYFLEDLLILSIQSENDMVLEFSLEGCFSCLDEGLIYCYKVIKIIDQQFTPIRVLFPSKIEVDLSNSSAFINTIKASYLEKYDNFIATYGMLNLKVLPRNHFYEANSKNKKRKIFGFFS